jgi:branched-chain amino acid transport system substrate-binding protein
MLARIQRPERVPGPRSRRARRTGVRIRFPCASIPFGIVLLALGGLVTPHTGAPSAQAQPAPLRIGVLAPLTGFAALPAKTEMNGIRLRLKEINHEIAGRKIELIVEDSAGDPPTAITKARKLVERDKVEIILGPLVNHVVQAVQQYTFDQKIPMIPLVAGLPETARHPNQLVPSWNGVSLGYLFGEYAYKKLGYRKMVIMSSNYTFGRRSSEGFRDGFVAAGGSIVKEVYPPLGTPDFAPFLASLPTADAVYSFIGGADAIRYVKQRAEVGLNERLPLLCIISTVEGTALPSQGDTALGSVAISHYFEDLDLPANRQFVAAYVKEYGEQPLGYYPALGYTIIQILEEGLKRTGGKTTPYESLVGAFRQVDFASPQGRFRFDPVKPFPIIDYYILKVVKKGGRLGYEVLDVLKEVKP